MILDSSFPRLIAPSVPYPNPFNSTTTIRYRTGSAAHPTLLGVYGLDGRMVAELSGVSPPWLTPSETADRGGSAAEWVVVWNATGIPAGEYIVRLQAGGETASRKIALVK